MPPKSAARCWPPRRSARTTAGKSIPALSESPNIALSPPSSPTSSSSTAAIPTEPVTPPSTGPSYEKNSPQKSPAAAILKPCRNSEKTLAADSVKSIPPEKENGDVETRDLTESVNEGKDEVVLPCDPVEKPETSIQAVAEPESGTGEVVGGGKGTRKVIRKTVRVVKRVIRKKVPKKVPVENSVDLSEVKASELVNDAVEQPDKLAGSPVTVAEGISNVKEHLGGVDDLVEKPVLVGEGTGKLNIREELEEPVKLDDGACVSGAIVGESCDDKSDFGCLEKETSQISDGAGVLGPVGDIGNEVGGAELMETVTLNIDTQVGEKGNDRSDMMIVNVETDEVMAEVDVKDANMCFHDSGEEKKVQGSVVVESERTDVIEDSMTKDVLEDSVENINMDIGEKQDVGLIASQNLGCVEEKYVVLVEEKDASLREHEMGNDLVDTPSIDSHDGLLLSGELEAVERRKRRKTEIFVGGLNKDAKEDDIKKAFDGAGTISDIRLVMHSKTGKNKGFAFVRFRTSSDANNALTKYSKVEICGKRCVVTPVEGNDTIFLGNIEKSWKTEDVTQLLEKAGIVNIDKVTLKADPQNIERNRGFAFVEFETNRDAKNAFHTMQKKNIFGRNINVKVDWAQPLIEPAEEEILKVKSVYAEYLPSSWNEKKVKEYFKTFGEIENVVLAKDLPASRRNDFAFINYTTREAALACIDAFRKERFEDNGTKVKVTVSLAKPITMRRQTKHATGPTTKQLSQETPKVSQASIRSYEPRNKGKSVRSIYDHKVDTRASTNDELVHILRQQASINHVPLRPGIGTTRPDSHFLLPGGKRPYPFAGHDPLYLEARGLPRMRVEGSNPISGPSSFPRGGGIGPFPYHQQLPDFEYEPVQGRNSYPGRFETRERAPYFGNSNTYRRY